jgi:acetate---CoA ligase (ADP-forming)
MKAMTRRVHRELRPFFDPDSIAVVGASNNPEKWGYWLARGALRGEGRRAVYLVNRRSDPVLSRPVYPSLAELPRAPELVVTAVPEPGFDSAIDTALLRGTKAIIAINAGFAEAGPEGEARQRHLVRRVRAAGAMLMGPNCLGVLDNGTDLEAAWLPVGREGLAPGPIAVISQSGNLGLDIGMLARERGLGISRFIAVGNQGDVSLADFIANLAGHEPTKVIAVYFEDAADGRALFAAARAAVEAGKHVLVIAAGGSDASSRAARSHTGSLTSAAEVVAAACRAVGAIKVGTPDELVDTAHLLLSGRYPRGPRLAVLSDGGGHGVLATDVAVAAGLTVPSFSPALRARLAAEVSSAPSVANPVDLGGAIEPTMFERTASVLAECDEVDGVVIVGGYAQWPELDEEIGRAEVASAIRMARRVSQAGKPVLVQTFFPHTSTADALRSSGVPVYRSMRVAIETYARVLAWATADHGDLPGLPEPIPLPPRSGYFAARGLLAQAGIGLCPAIAVATVQEARIAASEFGFPVALKAVSVPHKSSVGGVALGLATPEGVQAAFEQMTAAGLTGEYAVEQMADGRDGVELILGCQRDRRFGPVLLLGFGGIGAELLRDTVTLLAPCSAAVAESALRRLGGAAMLTGFRGRPAVNLAAAAEVAARLSALAAAHPAIAEIEINPLLVTPSGAMALDAYLVTSSPGAAP